MRTLGGVAAVGCALLLLAGCSSDSGGEASSPSPTISLSPYTLPSDAVTSLPASEIPVDTPTPTPTATTVKVSKKAGDRFIKLLYGMYTDEWVTQDPDDWIDLSKTTCAAYRRGAGDAELSGVLSQNLSDGAVRWFLASAKTLICPDAG